MKQENNQYSTIYVDIKNYMVKVGLTIKHESSDSHKQYLCTEIKIGGDYTIRLSAGHNSQEKIVFIQSDFGYSVPAEKRQKVGKLIDLINNNIDTNHFSINPHTGTLGLGRGIPVWVWNDSIDIKEFNFHVKEILRDSKMFFPLIAEQTYSNQKPKKLLAKLLKDGRKIGKRTETITFAENKKDGARKLIKNLDIGKHPFIIHASSLENLMLFPTHSHGLHDLGMHEMFIDPLAFGPEKNAVLIIGSYKFFIRDKNAKMLQTILNGEVIELTEKQLFPKAKDNPNIYCYREVSPEFEAAKMAYDDKEIGMDPDMRFIQIWIKGDDYVLKDEYYQGGVMW